MNIASLFWQACDKEDPDDIAIATESRVRTYSEVRKRVARLTRVLSERGIGRGDRVGIIGRNAPEYIEAYWACVSVGASAVTINFRLTLHELRLVSAFADVKAYFCGAEFIPNLFTVDPGFREKLTVFWRNRPEEDKMLHYYHGATPFEEVAEASNDVEPVLVDVDGDEWYSIIFTGGTSGTPKAVGRSHRNVLAMIALVAGNDLVGVRRTLMACTPFFHIAGQMAMFTLIAGGTVVLLEGTFSGRQFLQLVERFKIDSAFVVPAMITAIAQMDDDHTYNTASLRHLRSGGAPLPLEIAKRLASRFPKLRFSNGGGSTEAGTMGSGWWDDLSRRPFGCVGRAPIGQEVRIVADDGRECSSGQIGEILVRGAQLASGYWKDKDRSAAAFIEGWQHSADVGWIDEDGYLYLVDRKSDLIISGGENIYAREIEEALYRVARVKEAAVIGVPDEEWGEVPMAILVTVDGQKGIQDIRDALTDWIASYKQPRHYVVMEALPRTSIGKVDKNRLRAILKS